jgi:hypothetical protein
MNPHSDLGFKWWDYASGAVPFEGNPSWTPAGRAQALAQWLEWLARPLADKDHEPCFGGLTRTEWFRSRDSGVWGFGR